MGASRPPVVVVIFDALPVHLLEDDQGRIDSVRFPNFAAFAQDGTWYRNATTVSEATPLSIPAMLDGRAPRPSTPPTRTFATYGNSPGGTGLPPTTAPAGAAPASDRAHKPAATTAHT